MNGSSDCGVRRVVRPQRRYMPSIKEHDDRLSRLLSKLGAFYKEASDRLAVRTRPVTLARFLESGICIGLLDPVSNIIVNTICTSDLRPDYRQKVLVCTDIEEKLDELARRSLEALVSCLVYFFPYLAKWEAVLCLLLTDGDLVAAARYIVWKRRMEKFSLDSPVGAPAFEEAITLAAKIAKHSHPKQLAHVWMLLSSRLHQVLDLLLEVQSYSPRQKYDDLKAMIEDPVVRYLSVSWDLAYHRLFCCYSNNFKGMPMAYSHTRSLRMVLLDTIHAFYLKAMAMLPSGELRSRLHRSLLRAGHCYGPLDPVSNIILNTIWYDTNFPSAETPVLDVIGPDSLTRLESRSFYGLVSFLQTRYHCLSENQIVEILANNSCQLSIADPKFMLTAGEFKVEQNQHQHCPDDDTMILEQLSPCTDLKDAFAAAAIAAWHPNPEEQAKFLASWHPNYLLTLPVTSKDVWS